VPPPLSLVESYRQTSLAKLWVGVCAGLCGGGLGSAVSAYVLHQPTPCVSAGALVGFAASYLGGNLGAFFRALAVTLILTLSRWRSVTGQYAFVMQLKCALLNRRHRFPPNAPPNLRAYRPTPEHPLEFSMTICLIASGLLGAILGWMSADAINLFLFPPSLVALASAVFFAFTATSETTLGDLVRCAAMKGVGVASLVTSAAAETEVRPKAFALAGQLGKKAQQLEQRFHLVARVVGSVRWVVDRVGGNGQAPTPGARPGRRKGKRGGRAWPPGEYYGEPPMGEPPAGETPMGYSGGYNGGYGN
jgi:MFS family permease